LVPPGSAIGSFAVVRLCCDAKSLIDPSSAQDESSFRSSHKEDVASMGQFDNLAGSAPVPRHMGQAHSVSFV
jgi:hypothetical protein